MHCSRVKNFDAKHPAPVGSYPAGASPYGCLDMVGNVSEWCADLCQPSLPWDESLLPPPGSSTDTAQEKFNAFPRVIRGGDWTHTDRTFFHATGDDYFFPAVAGDTLGFRCVVRPKRQKPQISMMTTQARGS